MTANNRITVFNVWVGGELCFIQLIMDKYTNKPHSQPFFIYFIDIRFIIVDSGSLGLKFDFCCSQTHSV